MPIPTHGHLPGKGLVRILRQHSKDHFLVLTDRDETVLAHRKRITFTKPPKPKGPIVKDAFGIEREISKSEKPPLAPDKLRHKKKVSAATSIVSSTFGIAGLGALAAAKGGPKLAGKLVKHPKLMAKAPQKAKVLVNDQKKIKIKSDKAMNAAWGLSTGATGIGGIGGYNYASIQRAEARKKKL